MVYRFSWLAGIFAIIFAFAGLAALLRPTPEGTAWQYIVAAALILGATITWTALTYRAHPVIVVVLNLAALAVAIGRISAPETTRGFLPTGETISAISSQLTRAFSLIRTGIEPVQPITGIVIVLAVVFWLTGVMLSWGLMRGHPYVRVDPASGACSPICHHGPQSDGVDTNRRLSRHRGGIHRRSDHR